MDDSRGDAHSRPVRVATDGPLSARWHHPARWQARANLLGGAARGAAVAVLANGMLDDLAKAWERRGLRIARDADDFLIFVRAQRAATRGLHSISRFSERHLRRRVNPNKSQAARLSAGAFLGFALRRATWHWTESAVQWFKDRVHEMTSRSHGRQRTARIAALKR